MFLEARRVSAVHYERFDVCLSGRKKQKRGAYHGEKISKILDNCGVMGNLKGAWIAGKQKGSFSTALLFPDTKLIYIDTKPEALIRVLSVVNFPCNL
jgi:hypothetical protein